MKSRLIAVFLLASMLFAVPAGARETVAVVDHDNIAVATASGQAPSAEQVRQAIVAAAGAREWSVTPQGDGRLLATLTVRAKHTIMVDIAYNADRYSLTYRDSVNMKYGQRDGQPVIHPFYNRWVQTLKDAIRLELLKT